MILCYDLRFATDKFTGIGTHAHHLLRALLDGGAEIEWQVVWNPALPHSRFPIDEIRGHPRVRWIECGIPPLSPLSVLSLGRLLRRLRPSAFISPYIFTPLGAPCPSIITMHDALPARLPAIFTARARASFWGLAQVARAAAVVLTDSDFSRREILACTPLRAERVRVARLGLPDLVPDAQQIAPRGGPAGRFALVVGANRPHKNLEVLVRTWAGFGAHPPLELVCTGPHDDRFPRVEAMARAAGAYRVTDVGGVSLASLAWLYRHADVVLFPTRYEGFGLPLIEAFGYGTPVIASDLPVLREIGEGYAHFVPADDEAAWTEALRAHLALSATDRAALATRARAGAAAFSYARTARDVLRAIHETLRGAA